MNIPLDRTNPRPLGVGPAWLGPGALTAVICFGSVLLAPRIEVLAGMVSPIWLTSGVALWCTLRWGPSAVPYVAVGVLGALRAAQVRSGLEMLEVAGAAGLEAVCGGWVARRLGLRPQLDRGEDALILAAMAVLAPLAGSSLRLASLGLGRGWSRRDVGQVLTQSFSSHALSILVFTPLLLLLFSRRPGRLQIWRKVEAAALAGVLVGLSFAVFEGLLPANALYSQAFLLFPVVLWASLRFGVLGGTGSVLVVSILAVWGTSRWLGPFADQVIFEGALSLQVFLGVLALTSLLMASSATERRQVLAQSELLAAAIRSLREGVLLAEVGPKESRILYANEGLLQMSGFTLAQVLGQPPSVFASDAAQLGAVARLAQAAAEGQPLLEEWVFRSGAGSTLETELQASPVRRVGDTSLMALIFRDIHERKHMQDQLVLAERMASLGTIAAGVGHEINNPLAYVINNVQLAARALTRGGGAAPSIQTALDALVSAQQGAERVRLLVRNLRVLTRDAAHDRQVMDLNATLDMALSMSAQELRQKARLIRELGTVPPVVGNDARMGQVFLNILVNAAQAIADGDPSSNVVRVRSGCDARGWALVEIQDTGAGIPAAHLPRVFEPFFTTKPAGVGTGLGLSISHQLVKEAGGEIVVASEVGRGSTFRVLLPPAPARPGVELRTMEDPASVSGEATELRGRILIIDDEVRLAQSMRMLLVPPHEVVLEHEGAAALRLLLDAGPSFDVIFCDLQMPGVGGPEIHARLQRERPELLARMVFFSGGAYTQAAREFLAQGQVPVLEKPVRPHTLLAEVDRVLRGQPPVT